MTVRPDVLAEALEGILDEAEGPGSDSALAGHPSGTIVVALSGGLDSCVLLHALRFPAGRSRGDVPAGRPSALIVAAHFDHGMRPGSAEDAAWVRGLCRAWRVELLEGAVGPVDTPPRSEEEARTLRYDFLRRVAAERRGVLVTAHHADDQAETVLFRVLRGTGIEGLAGIPPRRVLSGGDGPDVTLLRPLLGVTRAELEEYAGRHLVAFRPDPTNDGTAFARNVIRNELLPRAEADVAPGARRSLARLAEIAGDEEAAWAAALRFVLPALDARGLPASEAQGLTDAPRETTDPSEQEGPSCLRKPLLATGPELASRLLRLLGSAAGVTLDRDATRRAYLFVRDSQSGRRIELGRGVELHLKDDRVVVVPSRTAADIDVAHRRAVRPTSVSAESSE